MSKHVIQVGRLVTTISKELVYVREIIGSIAVGNISDTGEAYVRDVTDISLRDRHDIFNYPDTINIGVL